MDSHIERAILEKALVQVQSVLPEAIEWANTIQPHGVLLVLNAADLTILQVSANSEPLGQPAELLNRSLADWLEADSLRLVQHSLTQTDELALCRLTFRTATGDRAFNTRWQLVPPLLLVELEPLVSDSASLNVISLTQSIIRQLRSLSSLEGFLQTAITQLRQLTQFDRVMIYQFDQQGAGSVVAEAKREDLSPYLGLHYPATDIPQPVRQLYAQGRLRLIPDVTASPIALVPTENPLTGRAIDLSSVMLRGVDPCCVAYHHNMGVSALMVMPIVQQQQLWGLIACHHQTPKRVSPELRQACDLLGQFLASELDNKVNLEERHYLDKLRSLQSEFLESIAQVEDLRQALIDPAPRLLELMNAQGAAVCLEDEITLVGQTPSLEQVQALLQWTDRQVYETLFHTNALPKLFPAAASFKQVASGLLLLCISKLRRYYILWFRPEVLQTVNWAGDPTAAIVTEADGSLRLSPRQSFAQWQETVQLTSLPWQSYELKNALDLRNAIVGIVLNKAEELAAINQELSRSNQELDSFAYVASHDLKEPLRGIHNYSTLLLKSYGDRLDDVGRSRLQTLVRLTRRMESLIDVLLKFSRLGQTDLQLQPTDLNRLLEQILPDLCLSYPALQPQISIPRPLPIVQCDPVLIGEVFVNLLSNAFKYTDKPNPAIEIGYLDSSDRLRSSRVPESAIPESAIPEGSISQNQTSQPQSGNDPQPNAPLVLYVQDNGIGIRDRHLETIFRLFKRLHEQALYGGGTGAGLTIAKKIIQRHGGEIWAESRYGAGSTFYFSLRKY